ncbi:tripartite tricarboxylate transporter substrate binding protein [Xanthobacter sp. YC-JY1]|uniref:Bug family tripartite tricarboxylate transporter substrate binding protein n=1 Tax=Xanthobacter TaxID=279 RepID=UPI001F1E832C|nr:tripartite tricarboxylate transporter substrate binding protein [Xanthobacter sp. YC-JY1]UJX47288.1 tripartite tricarboxylate transporter substrate binding protein [Xanthobacter sp. YC-JY1]
MFRFIASAACALSLLAALPHPLAAAQNYPSRAVTVIVPFAAGGPTDAAGRIIARAMQGLSGEPFVVENVAGAGSTIGAAKVAHTQPDGYTLLLATSSAMVVAPHLYAKIAYDGFRSFAPIGLITEAPFILLVPANSRFDSYDALVAYARAHPGQLNYGTPGLGTVQHLGLERLLEASGVKATHVPYKGTAPSLIGFLGGEVDFIVETPNAAMPMIKGDRARPLAVTGPARLPALPDVPTVADLGVKGADMRSWFALMAPRDTPAPVLATLRSMLERSLADPANVKALREAGFEVATMDLPSLQKMMEQEYGQFGQIIKAQNLVIR